MPIKVVFVCLLDFGHLQIPIALGKSLLYRDPENEIYFIVDEETDIKIKRKCSQFKTIVFDFPKLPELEDRHKKRAKNFGLENEERFKEGVSNHGKLTDMWKSRQFIYQDLIKQLNPDLIIVENLFNLPFIMCMEYKWIQIVSTSPLKIANQKDYPPMGSGVDKDFQWFCDIFRELGEPYRKMLDDWYQDFSLVRKPSLSHIQASELFNVYMYPKPLNYFEPKDLDGNWIQRSSTLLKDEIEEFIRSKGWVSDNSQGKEILTPDFLSKEGKTVLFSVGTLVSESVEIFDQLIPAIANCKHKFIISKGKHGDQFKLPDNCKGVNNFNQIELLKSGLIDCFVTHCGNNSLVESCYFNVPMVAIPFFGDQHDNGCRLETFGIGKRLNFKNVSSESLNSAIDFVTTDETVKRRMKEISEIVRKDNTMEKITDLVIETCLKRV